MVSPCVQVYRTTAKSDELQPILSTRLPTTITGTSRRLCTRWGNAITASRRDSDRNSLSEECTETTHWTCERYLQWITSILSISLCHRGGQTLPRVVVCIVYTHAVRVWLAQNDFTNKIILPLLVMSVMGVIYYEEKI